MTLRSLGIIAAVVVVTGSATAAATRVHHEMSIGSTGRDSLRPGPDSARVASLLAALGNSDALVCELIADQIGIGAFLEHRHREDLLDGVLEFHEGDDLPGA